MTNFMIYETHKEINALHKALLSLRKKVASAHERI